MRPRSPLALVGVLIILLLAVVGFAAFSPPPIETSATVEGVVLPPTASGSVAGSVLASRLAQTVAAVEAAPTATTADSSEAANEVERSPSEATTTLATTTTTAAPTTTTAAPTTTTTTAAPTTTTTAPPTTTTTTPPTTTTTTTPPTTTTAAPPPAAGPLPPEAEQWRDLVGAYFAADVVDDALSVLYCESRGDPAAYNAASGASGLFQFIPSTWATASEAAGWSGADVFDPEPNIASAAWLYAAYDSPWSAWSCKP